MGSRLGLDQGEQFANKVGEVVHEEDLRPIVAHSLVVGARACQLEQTDWAR